MEKDKMDTPRESPRETKSPEEERGWMPGSEAVARSISGRRTEGGAWAGSCGATRLGAGARLGGAGGRGNALALGAVCRRQHSAAASSSQSLGSRRDSEGAGARGRERTTRAGEMIDETDQAECEVVARGRRGRIE